MWKQLLIIATLMSFLASTLAQTGSRMKSANDLPPGYWPLEKSQRHWVSDFSVLARCVLCLSVVNRFSAFSTTEVRES
jgi:hypothetical protein